MALLGQMIRTRRLEEFVIELVQIHNEEMEDQAHWEIWLHKCFDKSFAEFKEAMGIGNETAAPTQEETESIVQESYDLLNSFVPDEGLVNMDGTVQTAGNDSD